MKKISKQGISVITLVITIIVLGILATAVIVSLTDTNVIEQTAETVFKDDISKIKENIELEKINKMLNEASNYDNIVSEEYKDILKITNDGCLTYIGKEDDLQKEWAKDMNVKIVESEDVIHFAKLKEIEDLANSYYNLGNKNLSRNVLTTQYIRKDRYSGTKWSLFVGNTDANFTSYVDNNKTQVLFGNNDVFKDPITGANIDFVHQIATLNAYFYDEPDIFDAYTGWAGDLCTILVQVHNYRETGVDNENDLIAYAKSLIGSTGEGSTMDISDLLADIDAANIYDLMTDSVTLNETMYSYYFGIGEKTCANRYMLYKQHIEEIYKTDYIGKFDNEDHIYLVALAFIGGNTRFNDSVFDGLYAKNLIGTAVYNKITNSTKKYTAQAFAEYISEQL